ncbi:MAG: hypothetical protein M0Z69_05840 [Actinomycetota bacterium]|nr:hypothetical protein [Actinomycetota bacterium]
MRTETDRKVPAGGETSRRQDAARWYRLLLDVAFPSGTGRRADEKTRADRDEDVLVRSGKAHRAERQGARRVEANRGMKRIDHRDETVA